MRRVAAVGILIAVAIAVLFLVPAGRVDLPHPPSCPGNVACVGAFTTGYGSITYCLIGTGGVYDSSTNQYIFAT